MDRNTSAKLFEEVCKRWHTQPTEAERKRWQTTLEDITEEEARAAIEEHARSRYGSRIPYSGNIRRTAMANRLQSVQSNSLFSGGDPYPSAEEDNRHFLEYMAETEGIPVEEMDEHIKQYIEAWRTK